MLIREARTTDANALSDLLGQLGYPSNEKKSAEKIEAYKTEGYKMLLAEQDQKVIGFIALHYYHTPHLPGPTGRITAFCIDETSRGHGLGTKLLQAAEEYFNQQNCFKIEVTSNQNRTETHRYYLKLNYQETSRHFVKFLRKD